MNRLEASRLAMARAAMGCACIGVMLAILLPAGAQAVDKNAEPGSSVRFDRVVAVVNRQAILESDVEDEMELSVLEPRRNARESITESQALERLISRALIQQQIRQEDLPATELKPDAIASRISQIRTDLPACVRADCKTDAGWKAFLAQHNLTPPQVEDYLRHRIEILSFIEMRFRQGIRITPDEVETYYKGTLLPQYPAGQTPPPLQEVSSRIEEILLQQRVNQLFDDWLANLRKQGQIEVLDPALETALANSDQGATKE
jgi:peptidyl-prolyl cis-trans isomerase SurA